MAMLIDGPRAAPSSGGRPNALVVLLHGYGSNGEDLIGLAPHLSRLAPGAQFIAPDAPQPVPGYPGGRQWFGLGAMDPVSLERGVRAAAEPLSRFLDHELARYALSQDRLALVGFSQGAMMALHVGLRRQPGPSAIIGFSGALTGARSLRSEARAWPAILLVHGDRDDRIPLDAMFDAADAIAVAGRAAQWHVSYGVPHAIGPDGLELAGAFLKDALAGKFAHHLLEEQP